MKEKTDEWKHDLKKDLPQLKIFYNFVFDYLKEDKKILSNYYFLKIINNNYFTYM